MSHVSSRFLAAVTLLAAGSLIGAACSTPPAPTKESAAAATSATPGAAAHGAHDAVPGSHEDWCGEHGVAESKCTRCNAKLIPAFKASNDWCEEHGLPESQCTKCNPDLKIVRPPKGG